MLAADGALLVAIFVPIGCVLLAVALGGVGWLINRASNRRSAEHEAMQEWMAASAADRNELHLRVAIIETYLWTPGTDSHRRRRAQQVSDTLRDRLQITDLAADVVADVLGEPGLESSEGGRARRTGASP